MENIFITILYKFGTLRLKELKKSNKQINICGNKYVYQIAALYNKPLFWHGTGRYQYSQDGKINDILEMIFENKCLLPQKSLISKNKKPSISLSKNRIYSSLFALMHTTQQGKLIYQFGSRKFWLWLILLYNFAASPIGILKETISYSLKNGKINQAISQSKVKKSSNIKKKKSFISQYLYGSEITSDIKGNYPILIAIKRTGIKLKRIDRTTGVFEARTERKIPLNIISHIEVPYSTLSKTEKLMKKHKINLTVIPYEACEYFCKKNLSIRKILKPA